jgi:hypothetical protein
MSERSGGRTSCRRRELLDCFGGGSTGLIPRVSWPGSDTSVSGPGQFAFLTAPLGKPRSALRCALVASFVAIVETERRVSPIAPALGDAQRRRLVTIRAQRDAGVLASDANRPCAHSEQARVHGGTVRRDR